MKPYIGLVHKDGTSAYGISFPDAPGCFSAADTLDDVFAGAEEALTLWRDGMAEGGLLLPPTRDLSAIRGDPEWAEAFADVALVIAVEPPAASLRDAA